MVRYAEQRQTQLGVEKVRTWANGQLQMQASTWHLVIGTWYLVAFGTGYWVLGICHLGTWALPKQNSIFWPRLMGKTNSELNLWVDYPFFRRFFFLRPDHELLSSIFPTRFYIGKIFFLWGRLFSLNSFLTGQYGAC